MWELAWAAIGIASAVLLDAIFGRFVHEARRTDPKARQIDVEVAVAVLVGILLGFLLAGVAPATMVPGEPIKGLSGILFPLGVGTAMHHWGKRRERAGLRGSAIATWYGGGIFGLGLAIGRLVLHQ